jgi:hypothetical protein
MDSKALQRAQIMSISGYVFTRVGHVKKQQVLQKSGKRHNMLKHQCLEPLEINYRTALQNALDLRIG